jgi:hypothetical protein
MNDITSPEPTLVLGGTGKTGRRVVERLTARGLPVRIASPSGEPRFDWKDRSTWNTVLEGAGSVYVSHYWDAIPGAAVKDRVLYERQRARRRTCIECDRPGPAGGRWFESRRSRQTRPVNRHFRLLD